MDRSELIAEKHARITMAGYQRHLRHGQRLLEEAAHSFVPKIMEAKIIDASTTVWRRRRSAWRRGSKLCTLGHSTSYARSDTADDPTREPAGGLP
jgi:hypothetical protein